jgi:hypothetical protein
MRTNIVIDEKLMACQSNRNPLALWIISTHSLKGGQNFLLNCKPI